MGIENRDPLNKPEEEFHQPELGTVGAVLEQFDKIIADAKRDGRDDDYDRYLHAKGLAKILMERNQTTDGTSAEEMLKIIEDYEDKLGKGDGKLRVITGIIEGELRGKISAKESEK